MAVEYDPMKMAMMMMQAALNILDDIGERDGAAHLQQAINVVGCEPVGVDIKDLDAVFDSPAARTLLKRLERSTTS